MCWLYAFNVLVVAQRRCRLVKKKERKKWGSKYQHDHVKSELEWTCKNFQIIQVTQHSSSRQRPQLSQHYHQPAFPLLPQGLGPETSPHYFTNQQIRPGYTKEGVSIPQNNVGTVLKHCLSSPFFFQLNIFTHNVQAQAQLWRLSSRPSVVPAMASASTAASPQVLHQPLPHWQILLLIHCHPRFRRFGMWACLCSSNHPSRTIFTYSSKPITTCSFFYAFHQSNGSNGKPFAAIASVSTTNVKRGPCSQGGQIGGPPAGLSSPLLASHPHPQNSTMPPPPP